MKRFYLNHYLKTGTPTELMDVLYIRRSLARIHAIVFGHVSEFQHIRVKTNLEAARMCIWSYTMHLIAGI
jgi:hypothetical protein